MIVEKTSKQHYGFVPHEVVHDCSVIVTNAKTGRAPCKGTEADERRLVLMDINILLALQNFRNGIGSSLADFLSKMTFLGELSTAFVIMAVIYWCVS